VRTYLPQTTMFVNRSLFHSTNNGQKGVKVSDEDTLANLERQIKRDMH